MTTFAATAAPAGANLANGPPTCQNCSTSTTPLWRRDEAGSVLCNACGLFLKLHGRPRPISLKTDVIKSRNRVKGTGQGAKKRPSGDTNGLPASHPDASAPPPDPSLHQRRASVKIPSGHSDRSASPISRTGTPGIHNNPNIAPQHMFDGVTLGAHDFHSPSIPAFALRHPSPGSTSSINGSHLGPPLSYDEMKTRVSELEVINDLFRGRVSELEASEQEARRNEMLAREREMELRRRVEELEAELGIGEDGSRKRVRLSDVVHESRATTPTP